MDFDLAQVIEGTRTAKRRLCQPPFSIEYDEVFDGDFLDPDHLEILMLKARNSAPFPAEQDFFDSLSRLISAIRKGPQKPADEILCTRYTSGECDARTVCHITGWSVIELYDKCMGFGLKLPEFSCS